MAAGLSLWPFYCPQPRGFRQRSSLWGKMAPRREPSPGPVAHPPSGDWPWVPAARQGPSVLMAQPPHVLAGGGLPGPGLTEAPWTLCTPRRKILPTQFIYLVIYYLPLNFVTIKHPTHVLSFIIPFLLSTANPVLSYLNCSSPHPPIFLPSYFIFSTWVNLSESKSDTKHICFHRE